MDTLRQLGGGLLLAAFSAALVIGGISLALAESYVPVVPTPTDTQAPVVSFPTPTSPSLAFITETIPPSPSPTATVPPPTSCPPPSGWVAITVGPGDDLLTLASRYKTTREQLLAANCLFSNDLPTGSILYVPPIPTHTPVPCGPPAGWIRYSVQPGNTLYSLSQAYGVSLSQLQFANCMVANQYNLVTGQTLWVPNVVTRTPRATATATLTPVVIVFPTLTGTASATFMPTDIPTSTSLPTGTSTGTATSTASPPPTATPPATATVTAFPTQTSQSTTP
ncbi:MAG: LysM peptidoglycan-binding domain-containing protein [Anaerolineales bacterium]|nr:LysM peptidoglycan-binding domain-containing protein [Anaerolineales bacterium]